MWLKINSKSFRLVRIIILCIKSSWAQATKEINLTFKYYSLHQLQTIK
jgi:hypothetical protein